jgi:replicative DNA helicase
LRRRPSGKAAEHYLDHLQRDAAKEHDPDKRKQLQEKAGAYAVELEAARIPVALRLLTDDCSPEKLASLLCEQGGRMAILSPEGDLFDMMAGRYSSNGASNLGIYLKGHSGDPHRVDRIGRPSEHIPRPTITLGLTIQPSVLRKLTDRPQFKGMPDRILRILRIQGR